jgi:hypothetical protein
MSAPTPPDQPRPGAEAQPTRVLPQTPPNPPPPSGPPSSPAGAQPRNTAEDEAAESNRKQLTGFKIATVALAVLSVLLIIAVFTLNNRYNDSQAQAQAEIDGLEQQISALQSEESAIKSDATKKIADAQAEINKLANELRVDKRALRVEDRQLTKAHNEYTRLQAQEQKEKQESANAQASLKTQAEAARSRAELAEHCAAIAYSGLQQAYEEFEVETVKQVARWLSEASDRCSQVVNTYAG